MELQRLVIEDPENPLSIDFHPGLTVAFHENPALRARLVEGLIEALGPGRSGMHLELIDHDGRYLVAFRPRDGRHRVIDAGRSVDVSAEFASPGNSIDILGRAGLSTEDTLRLIRVNAGRIDRGCDTLTDNHRMARHLAALDQPQLWAAAEQLAAAEARLNATAGTGTGPNGDHAAAAIQTARALQQADAARAHTESVARGHRSVLLFGLVVGGLCAAIAVTLLAFEGLLEDKGWTAKVLLVLAVAAVGFALWDRRGLNAARRDERRLLDALGASSYEALSTQAGNLADPAEREALLAAADEYEPLAARWKAISGGAPLDWALANRPPIEQLAARRQQAAPYLAADLATEEGSLADSARVLVDKVVELREIGLAHERFPLLLDEPFVGLDPGDTVRLLEAVRRLAAQHQIVLVSGDPNTQAWASRLASSNQLSLVRIGQGGATGDGSSSATGTADQTAGQPA